MGCISQALSWVTIAENFWGCRNLWKTNYSLVKGRLLPSGKYSSPCYVLISTTEARKKVWFHLLPSLELAASAAFQIPFISSIFLHCDPPGILRRLQLPCSRVLEENPLLSLFFQSQPIPSGLFPFVSFSQQWPSHPQPTAFMLQKLPSCIWSYWILPCLSWRNPGIPRQPFLSSATLFSDRTLQTSYSLTRANSQISLVSPLSPECSLQRWEITPFSSL